MLHAAASPFVAWYDGWQAVDVEALGADSSIAHRLGRALNAIEADVTAFLEGVRREERERAAERLMQAARDFENVEGVAAWNYFTRAADIVRSLGEPEAPKPLPVLGPYTMTKGDVIPNVPGAARPPLGESPPK